MRTELDTIFFRLEDQKTNLYCQLQLEPFQALEVEEPL